MGGASGSREEWDCGLGFPSGSSHKQTLAANTEQSHLSKRLTCEPTASKAEETQVGAAEDGDKNPSTPRSTPCIPRSLQSTPFFNRTHKHTRAVTATLDPCARVAQASSTETQSHSVQ